VRVRILLLVDSYLPSTKAGAKLIHDLAREFLDLGHAVSVVAPDEKAAADPEVRNEEGVEVVRVRAGAIKGAALWLRGWNEARLSSVLWSRCRGFFVSRTFDLVVFYSPTIFFGALVGRLKELYRCPTYLILRDIFPQWAVDAGVLRKGLAYWYFKRKEYGQYVAADVIGVQSPANLDYFRERGLDRRHRLEVLYNWMRNEPARPSGADHRRRWGLEGKVVLFYGGNLGVAQDCDNLLRLASRLRQEAPEAHLLLVGEGSEVPRLRSIIAEQRLENVSIQDALPQDEYLELVGAVDIGLISLDRNLRTQNFPGKLLSYMHAGRPILASINPGNDLKDVVEAAGAGLVCLNGNDDAFLDCARRLIGDRALRETMGLASRKLLEERFSASSAANQILSAAGIAHVVCGRDAQLPDRQA
jgi:glycosyltransferase involved in cell wall biosynthesis